MLDGNDNHEGAPPLNQGDRVRGEILGALSELKAQYQTEGLELACYAIRALCEHIEAHEGLDQRVRFCDIIGESLSSEAHDVRAILHDDFRKRLN